MVESKEWNWEMVEGEKEKRWLEPSVESYYLIHRWKEQNKKIFLDLGCGLGRHTIQFAKNGFKVKAFDLSENAVQRAKQYANQENVIAEFMIGDMLDLPYEDESIDCIFCRNVISHTDTNGMKKVISELKRVLKKDGECYLTLGSKDTWGFKQENWPLVDENTRIRMDDGPENGIPHFYADYDLIQELFKEFSIQKIYQVQNIHEKKEMRFNSYHFHILIRK